MCVFCEIAKGNIPSSEVWSDELIYAFKDINPMAPTHILIIPREHIPSMDGVNQNNSAVIAHIFEAIPQIAAKVGLTNGYRVISNCGEDGCQSVQHLHFHLLGGKKLPDSLA